MTPVCRPDPEAEPAGEKAVWKRGDRCPNFDEQHPTAYALALEKARAAAGESAEASAS